MLEALEAFFRTEIRNLTEQKRALEERMTKNPPADMRAIISLRYAIRQVSLVIRLCEKELMKEGV